MYENISKGHRKLQKKILFDCTKILYLVSLYTMFTHIYLETTNPKSKFYELFRPTLLALILFSVLFHTLIYVGFFNILSYIFMGKVLSNDINMRMTMIAVLIMFFGYFGRHFHVKDILSAYHGDEIATRQHVDKLYITWIFIA